MITQEGVHIICLNLGAKAAALAHVIVKSVHRSLCKQLFGQWLLHYLHRVVLVFFKFVEWVFFLRLSRLNLLRSEAGIGLLRYVHRKYGPEIVEFAFLGLAGLDAHRTDKRIQPLRERRKALLLHVHALKRVIVDARLILK